MLLRDTYTNTPACDRKVPQRAATNGADGRPAWFDPNKFECLASAHADQLKRAHLAATATRTRRGCIRHCLCTTAVSSSHWPWPPWPGLVVGAVPLATITSVVVHGVRVHPILIWRLIPPRRHSTQANHSLIRGQCWLVKSFPPVDRQPANKRLGRVKG